MLKGGVIMDVINVEQAKVGMRPLMSWCWVCPLQHVFLFHPMQIAEAAGAVAVMALERIPADIRYDGGVARMSDPAMIREIKAAVTIPVMAKVRRGEEEHALPML
jgi:pyridoxal 5'-phosphate synthase pdxS subunit